ncbi:MAG: gephyrin-like molybdotransferase Glp [bacterium]
MLSFEEATEIVFAQNFNHGVERVPLHDSVGRILAEDVFSDIEMPPFNKSAVDGYACGSSIWPELPVTLEIIETIPAGVIPLKTILDGHCSKIMTGAMVPEGTCRVVMVEDTEMTGENLVRISSQSKGINICYKGEDIKTGDRVLEKGLRVAPAHVAVLASVGATSPLVAKLPRVGIISTGDELVEPELIPGIAQIRNSNASQLIAQVKTVPALPTYCGIAPDEGPELRKIIDRTLAGYDVVLLTGGVSMGDFDFVPSVLQEAGVDILFSSIAIQPGKPTVFGRRGNTFIFGLPGNPVSSFVLFEILVRPFLLRMMGNIPAPVMLKIPLGVDYSRRKSVRKSMIPVMIRDGAAFPVEYHGSAHINAYTMANGILDMEIGITGISKGELVNVRPL